MDEPPERGPRLRGTCRPDPGKPCRRPSRRDCSNGDGVIVLPAEVGCVVMEECGRAATHSVAQGNEVVRRSSPLPAVLDLEACHTLTVRRLNRNYRFYLDGVLAQEWTFTGTFAVLLNGRPDLVTEDTGAACRTLRVYDAC
jgi:hypothetical protein